MKRTINPPTVFNPDSSKLPESERSPWSQAVETSGKLLFVSGQTAMDVNGKVQGKGNIKKQTEVALENLKKILVAENLSMENVVQLMWFVTNIEQFYAEGASAIRRKYFPENYPSSTLIQIVRLAKPEMMVEVQAVAAYDTK